MSRRVAASLLAQGVSAAHHVMHRCVLARGTSTLSCLRLSGSFIRQLSALIRATEMPPKQPQRQRQRQSSMRSFFQSSSSIGSNASSVDSESLAKKQTKLTGLLNGSMSDRKRRILDDSDESDPHVIDESEAFDSESVILEEVAATKRTRPLTSTSGEEVEQDDLASNQESVPDLKVKPKPKKARKIAKVVAVEGPKLEFSWETGTPVPYACLCEAFELIEGTTKRLEILHITTSLFESVIRRTPENLLQTVYLCINRICPEYEGLELGIGESILMKAVAEATGRSLQKIKADMSTVGDLGDVAQSSRGNQSTMFIPKPLSVTTVFDTLKSIAKVSGGASQKFKIDKIRHLLVSCRNSEAKYLVRSLEGKLRIGLAGQTVIVALARASVLAKYEKLPSMEELISELLNASETVKSVYHELPSYDMIIPVLLSQPIDGLSKICHLTPGIPLKPMLAHPTKSITDVLDRFEAKTFTCEYKYDGERVQIHKLDNGTSFIYSRNSENLSVKYPDIIDRLDKICNDNVRSFIIDCEAVAWDRQTAAILPFQTLSTRKRKGVQAESISVQVCVYAFDILYLNGKSLLRESFEQRRSLLYSSFKASEGEFQFAKAMTASTIDDIQIFLDQSVADKCEGLMVKTLTESSSYEPSKRSRNWLKVKKDYIDGVGDSLDLIVIGGYIGKGKRTGVYGGFLLACYNPDREEYESICKIGTGFSDEDLVQYANTLKPSIISVPKPYYKLGEAKADVYFDASQVWEVKTADLSVSPVYQAAVGMIDANKGISLRFPRFIRVRDDKSYGDATTSMQIADMYRNQQVNKTVDKDDDDGDLDQY